MLKHWAEKTTRSVMDRIPADDAIKVLGIELQRARERKQRDENNEKRKQEHDEERNAVRQQAAMEPPQSSHVIRKQ